MGPMTRIDWILLPFVSAGLAALAYASFRWLGFLGIGIVGLFTGLVAVNLELEGGSPIGLVRTNIFAQSVRALDGMTRAEKAAWRAERRSYDLPLHVAKIASAGMVILGFGLFYLVQLPG